MQEWRDRLRREHEGQEGTFLFHLRCGPGWSEAAYDRLIDAMKACCKHLEGSSEVPRWIAELFWHLDWYVRQEIDRRWVNRDSVPKYYEDAWTNINHLAHWLFTGESREEDDFEPLVSPS